MNKPKTRNENIIVQEMENEILIYDLKINKAYCLNETSALIWQMCDGTKSVNEISQSLTKKLKQPIIEDFVWLALDGFKKDNLLEQNEQFEINFNGLNRRQVIRKIGLASLIMLPLVSSIVAPNAAMAASGLSANCASCSVPSQCASNNCVPAHLTCAPDGNLGGRQPGVVLQGICPANSVICAQCANSCCSGSTSYSGGTCSCIA